MTDTKEGSSRGGDASPDSAPDERSDIEQAVMARSDSLARGEGGALPTGIGGEGGAGGEVKNQDESQQ